MIDTQQINQLFYETLGKDLSMELSAIYADASSNAVDTFINDCIDFVNDYCFDNFAWKKDYLELKFDSDFQLSQYNKAIVRQLEYWLETGKLQLENGYDIEKGVFAEMREIEKRYIAPQALAKLRACGLANYRRF